MTGPRELLDQLDQALAAATPGPWHVAKTGGIDAGDYDTVIGRGDVDCMSHCYGGTSTIDGDNLPADAAAIVALRNAAPALLAAVRAAYTLADEWAAEADDDERWLRGPRVSVSEAREYPATIQQARSHTADLRAALAAALTPDTTAEQT